METYVQIAQVLALVSVSALCVYLIVTLVRLNGMIVVIQRELSEVAKSLKPILEGFSVVAEKLKSITSKVDEQVEIFKESFEAMQRMVTNIEQFEQRVQQRIEDPIMKVASFVGTLLERVLGFFGSRSGRSQ